VIENSTDSRGERTETLLHGVTPVVAAVNVSKSFRATRALKHVDLEGRAGEVHALLGANGAGKSTLVRILSGALSPDEGQLYLQGSPVHFANPHHAGQLGITAVFQELSLFPKLTVAQNILIGHESKTRIGWIDERKCKDKAQEVLGRLGAGHISPIAQVEDLSLADKQLVEIAKALSHDPGVILFDEPTSALGPKEAQQVFQIINQLRASGKSVFFISHRMEEIRQIADRVTVLRDGEVVGRLNAAEFGREKVERLMLGEKLVSFSSNVNEQASNRRPSIGTSPILEIEDLCFRPAFHEVSFKLFPGEVLGIAGLEGQGQVQLLHALFGLYRRGLSGIIRVEGEVFRPSSPHKAVKRGMAFVPEDRKTQGLFLRLPVSFNLSFAVLDQLKRFAGWISTHAERKLVNGYVDRLRISMASGRAAVENLSGGNQQKVLLGKWIGRDPKVMILCDPCRGVDIGAKDQVHHEIRNLVAQGKGIIIFSTELEELVGVADRVIVLFEGKIAGELVGEQISPANLLRLFFGERAEHGVRK
jgi:ribose transport system ATP-binding protein